MPEARKRPCTICRRWFRPDPQVGCRQRACGNPDCQTARRQKTQASWRNRNPGYTIAWRIDQRAALPEAPEPLRLPPPLNQLPWEVAKDQFGPQAADFIGVMGALIVRIAKDQIRPYLADPKAVPGTLPRFRKRPVPTFRILGLSRPTMHLEFHQLDLRWEHLRVREPHRQRHLLASLAESGQQTPIVVVLDKDNDNRYLVIDGHKRISALRQLGRDTVAATVWPMGEADALLLSRSQPMSPQESALEQGWLLSEMEQRFSFSFDELARRFDRSISWVSRRLALVELLPEAVQRHVREGNVTAQIAMKYLVPVARVGAEDCERMAAAFVKHRCDTRQAAQFYTAWREGSRVVRERILAEPDLFLKTQRQPQTAKPVAAEQVERDLEMALAILRRAGRKLAEALPEMNAAQQEQAQRGIESARRELTRMTERIGKEQEARHAEPGAANGHSGTAREGREPARDLAHAAGIACDGAQSPSPELRQRAGDSAEGKSRALPPTDPGSFGVVQGQSCASP